MVSLYIATPRLTIEASVNTMKDIRHPIPHGHDRGQRVRHETLIEVQTTSPTRAGDSGAPVFTKPAGGFLVGMLIAGRPDSTPDSPGSLRYVIPAAHILDPGRYIGSVTGESWRFVAL